jgi:hypothetical protein
VKNVIPFPKRCLVINLPHGGPPADVIVLPVVRIERNPDHPANAFEPGLKPNDLLMIAAANFIAARRRRRLKKLPKAFLSLT